MATVKLDCARVLRAKRAFSTRRAPPDNMRSLLTGDLQPSAGDLMLARVDMLGKQTKLELTDGRRAHMFPGDEIIVCFGNRYAPDQYEAVISTDLAPCDLVAAGGVAGIALSRHQRMIAPTKITPLGLIGDHEGRRLNLMQFRVEAADHAPQIPAILSLGTSMNAGKTLTATSLVRGLKRVGYSVAALKITGTGSGGDMWIVRDAGADVSLDFSDAGFGTTYLTPISDIERGTFRLLNHAAALGCEIAVIEIADGLQQLETAQLIQSDAIKKMTIGAVFAAYDAMGAKCGVDVLRTAGHEVLALSGRLGRSPLGVREAELATGLRVYTPYEFQEGALMPAIRAQAAKRYAASGYRSTALKRIANAVLAEVGVEDGSDLTAQPGARAAANRIQATVRETLSEVAGGTGGGQIIELTHPLRPSQDGSRDLLGRVADHIMRNEVAGLCGAAFGARLTGRVTRRNGFRIATWRTTFGPIPIRIPRLRSGHYRPLFLDGKTAGATMLRTQQTVEAVLSAADAGELKAALAELVRTMGGKPLDDEQAAALGAEVRNLVVRHAPAANGGERGFMTMLMREHGSWGEDFGEESEEHPDSAECYDPLSPSAEMDDDDMSAGVAFQSPHAIAGE